MKRALFIIMLSSTIIASGLMHIWEYKKIREFSATLQIQSEIEFKRTALLVIHQQVLHNAIRELDELRRKSMELKKQDFSELFKSLPEAQP
ncbi:MAG: hypothetical protein JXR78_04660 [Victivallales bacterium]|nr:hypothetical protein [Victivallales bacterium]